MIRVCSKPQCQRAYVLLEGENSALCPTCRAGMAPLLTTVGGKHPVEADQTQHLTSRATLDRRVG